MKEVLEAVDIETKQRQPKSDRVITFKRDGGTTREPRHHSIGGFLMRAIPMIVIGLTIILAIAHVKRIPWYEKNIRPFIESVLALQDAGWRVATHAVGDAAIDLVLDAYELAAAVQPITDQRWIVEHGFIPRDDHFPRMNALGVGVSAQDHLYLAAPSLVEYWGADRAGWTTPLRAYIDAGIPVSLGTDSPVVPYSRGSPRKSFSALPTFPANEDRTAAEGGRGRLPRI